MATPLKPWERRGGTSSLPDVASNGLQGNELRRDTSNNSPIKPSIPPRPSSVGNNTTLTNTTNTGYNSYSSPYAPPTSYYSPAYSYGGGYSNMYSGYGGYRPYGAAGGGMYGLGGGIGTGYNSGGMNSEEAMLVRRAEERTRTAFQSVESVVGAFASVSMMLESTYFAVQSCFRALLGVAQHFTRLKNHLWSILASIALLRRLRYLIRRLLGLLRLRQYGQSDELWDDISQVHASSQLRSPRLWPVVMFFTVIVGVPWLLWRLLVSAVAENSTAEEVDSWSQGTVARAIYDFTAERPTELTVMAGDQLSIAPVTLQPQAPGWILVGRNKRSGLVPANYIEILSASESGRNSSRLPSSTPP